MSLYQSQNHEQKSMTSTHTATLQIPTGGKIQSLALLFTTAAGAPVTEAQLRAEVGNIRLTINGKDVINCSAIQLLDLYEALGPHVGVPAAVAGVLELNVGRLLFTDPLLRDLVGYGTADVSNIQVQVTALTLTNVAAVQAISQRSAVSENLGMYAKYINYVQSFNSTGDHTVDTLPRDMDSNYVAVMIDDGASGIITFSECRVNANTITEKQQANVSALFASNKGYVQPTGYFLHAFADGSLGGRLPMRGVTDLRFINTFSAAPGAAGYNITPLTLIIPEGMKI